jgi:hypothetical protein
MRHYQRYQIYVVFPFTFYFNHLQFLGSLNYEGWGKRPLDKIVGNRISRPVLLAKYYLGDEIKKNEMGGACSAYRGREEVHSGFWWGNLRKSAHLENLGGDGSIILKWNVKIGGCGLHWSFSGQGQVACRCDSSNDILGSINRREISVTSFKSRPLLHETR